MKFLLDSPYLTWIVFFHLTIAVSFLYLMNKNKLLFMIGMIITILITIGAKLLVTYYF